MTRRRSTFVPIAALALALAACTAAAPDPALSLVSATGERRVAIAFESGPPAFLRVDERGTLVGWAEITDRSLFVLVAEGRRYRIRTAWVDNSGNPACMGVRRNADGPATVVAAQCRAGAKGQLFTFTRTGEHDSQGRRTYRIGTNAGTLVFNSRDGLHIEPREDLDVTGFAVLDQPR
jgi:hypothetical protein